MSCAPPRPLPFLPSEGVTAADARRARTARSESKWARAGRGHRPFPPATRCAMTGTCPARQHPHLTSPHPTLTNTTATTPPPLHPPRSSAGVGGKSCRTSVVHRALRRTRRMRTRGTTHGTTGREGVQAPPHLATRRTGHPVERVHDRVSRCRGREVHLVPVVVAEANLVGRPDTRSSSSSSLSSSRGHLRPRLRGSRRRRLHHRYRHRHTVTVTVKKLSPSSSSPSSSPSSSLSSSSSSSSYSFPSAATAAAAAAVPIFSCIVALGFKHGCTRLHCARRGAAFESAVSPMVFDCLWQCRGSQQSDTCKQFDNGETDEHFHFVRESCFSDGNLLKARMRSGALGCARMRLVEQGEVQLASSGAVGLNVIDTGHVTPPPLTGPLWRQMGTPVYVTPAG
eukprot:gene23691-biopygen8883